jgi:hypothetical protein
MAYSTCAQVAALIPNLLNSASSFDGLDTSIRPTSAQLVTFMSSGCALINAHLAGMGYSTPIGATVGIYGYLSDLEANYVAYRAEMARSSPRTAAGERGRTESFKKAFDDGLKALAGMDLSRGGVDVSSKFYAGGISEDDKETVVTDTDRVHPRFHRDVFDGNFASETSEDNDRDD